MGAGKGRRVRRPKEEELDSEKGEHRGGRSSSAEQLQGPYQEAGWLGARRRTAAAAFCTGAPAISATGASHTLPL